MEIARKRGQMAAEKLVATPLRAVLVDDEPLIRKRFRQMLSHHPEVSIVGEAVSAVEAGGLLSTVECDLVFLDVVMPEADGFSLISRVPPAAAVVFITAHERFAWQAFDVAATDYLLKPVDPERLTECLRRVRARLAAQPVSEQILVAEGDRTRRVAAAEIVAVEQAGDAAVRLLLDQLDPHFLFNVLMLVQAEADDPSRVRELVLRISQYLRTAIGRASPMLPVGQQAEECLAYLQLQRARFGQSLSWRIEVEPEAAGLLLPRLTVQTLVEHAVLDGFEVSGEATEILVAARLKGEQLLLEVVHPCSQERLSADASTEPEKQSQWLQDLCRRV